MLQAFELVKSWIEAAVAPKLYNGSCHCGAVQFGFEGPEIREGMRCNCSICKRKGAVLTNFTIAPEHMKITAEEGALSTYEFGTKTAKHHFCKFCGIFTFVETRLDPGQYRVNLGCVEGVDTFEVPVRNFDGTAL